MSKEKSRIITIKTKGLLGGRILKVLGPKEGLCPDCKGLSIKKVPGIEKSADLMIDTLCFCDTCGGTGVVEICPYCKSYMKNGICSCYRYQQHMAEKDLEEIRHHVSKATMSVPYEEYDGEFVFRGKTYNKEQFLPIFLCELAPLGVKQYFAASRDYLKWPDLQDMIRDHLDQSGMGSRFCLLNMDSKELSMAQKFFDDFAAANEDVLVIAREDHRVIVDFTQELIKRDMKRSTEC